MRLLLAQFTLLCGCLFAAAMVRADDGSHLLGHRVTELTQKEVMRKGVNFSDIGLGTALRKKDIHIKPSAQLRYEPNYSPQDGSKPFNLPIAEVQRHVDRAHAVLKKIQESQMYTALLEGKNIELPIGIKKTIGTMEYTICLDSIVITPTHAYGVLYAVIEDTKNNKKLAFWGKDVRFTKEGGFTGDARLELLQTYDLNFGPNTKISFLVDATHNNYIVFDCNGFKQLHVDARVFFSRNMLIPEDALGKPMAQGQVTTDFTADLLGLDNWLVQLSNIPRFQIKGLDGVSFQIDQVAFDYHSYENPSMLVFPAEYSSTAFIGSNKNPWEGVYAKNIRITLPEEFKLKSNTNARITVTAENMLIDRMGLTGKFTVNNLFPLSSGDMSGWDFSLDYLSVEITKNTFTGAAFNGKLVVPITKQTQALAYNGSIYPARKYTFGVALTSNLNFPLWGAGSVSLYQDSKLTVTLEKDASNKWKFTPDALLSGQMSIGAGINGSEGQEAEGSSDANNNLALAEIKFQKLHITTRAPYLYLDQNGGAFSFGSPAVGQKLAKLPITITDVGLVTAASPDRTGIKFTVNVNLVGSGESGGGFSGNATLTIWGKQGLSSAGKTTYTFYRVELNRIELKQVTIGPLTLGGFVEFYRDDLVYGSGFSAGIDVKIDLKASVITAQAKVIFGKKPLPGVADPYRYWAFDILVGFPSMPLFPPILYLNALGGGASYRMRMDNNVQNAKFVSNSGVTYVPDNTKGLGLKALIGIQGQSRKMYEGQIIFEIEFNAGGGLSQIAFSGYVQIASLGSGDAFAKLKGQMGGFVSKVKAAGGGSLTGTAATGSSVYGEITRMAEGGAVMAQWRMVYDNNNRSFSANIDVFVDVFDIIKGRNPNAHAGRIDILFTPREWHVFVGRPDMAMGLNIIGVVDIGGYFMMGQNLPTPLAMPNGRRAAFPNVPVDGMGLGARLKIGAEGGGKFWYRAGVEAGFDFLIWNVAGQQCNGKQKGVKGWYGAGQAFLYGYAGAGYTNCFNIPWLQCSGWDCCCFKIFKRRVCACPCCDWIQKRVCIDISGQLTVDISAQIEAANPTYAEGTVSVVGIPITIKVGKRC